jgi:N-acylneuraminate cytidylyltransferase
MSESLALIPARAGSKGVIGKNVKLLGGHPLMAWSIAAAKLSPGISRVIVSTDSPDYAALASHYGAETPFLRPAEFSADGSLDIDFLLHALGWLKEHEDYFPDFLVHLRPTNPVRDPRVIGQAIGLLAGRPEASSVISVYPVDYPPCKYLKKDKAGYLVGYLDGVNINIPRQDCPEAFRSNGYVDVLRAAALWADQSQLGSKILPLVTLDPGDIDVEKDFSGTEAKLSGAAPALWQYLEKTGPVKA